MKAQQEESTGGCLVLITLIIGIIIAAGSLRNCGDTDDNETIYQDDTLNINSDYINKDTAPSLKNRDYNKFDRIRSVDKDFRATEEGDVVFNSTWDGSISQVEDYLKRTLNDADSYESVEWYDANRYFSRSYDYGVRHIYRAKNSFGALVIKDQIFFMDRDGNVIDVIDTELTN